MKALFTLLVIVVFSGIVFANSSPSVSNVIANQKTDGSGIVDIYYTLSDADGDKCDIKMVVSDDGGVLVQRELDKSTLLLRECLAFGKEVFLGIGELRITFFGKAVGVVRLPHERLSVAPG